MSHPNAEQVMSALWRAEHVFCEQLSLYEPLEHGVAFSCRQFPDSAACNQYREVMLGDTPIAEAYARTESHFSKRGVRCLRWAPALGENSRTYESFLAEQGWVRRDVFAMVMTDWPAPAVDPAIRVLPARAMRKAFRTTFGGPDDPACASQAAEASERLNDSSYEMFVAMWEGVPAGRVGYHEVGDIASLRDLYVSEPFRGRGVGRVLLAHLIQMARRLAPRVFVAGVPADDARARAFLVKVGFSPAGTLPGWQRQTA